MFQPTKRLIRAALLFAVLLTPFCGLTQVKGQSQAEQDKTETMPADRSINPGKPAPLPDLIVAVFGVPSSAFPGDDIGPRLKVVARNIGGATAAGTSSAAENGYMIDIVLSRDTTVPDGFAIFSPTFTEDVLLRGGRISNTQDLVRRGAEGYLTGAGIPADTPPGVYYICARIDSGNKILESNEANNVDCRKLRIIDKTKVKSGKTMPAERPPNP